MKILIIGGMGVIGGAITEAAVKNHDVWVLSRRKPFDKWKSLSVKYLQGDWRNNALAERVVSEGFDVIVDTQIFNEKQLKRSADIVNGHCRQFIYISTDSVYPHPGVGIIEDKDINIEDVKWKYGYDKLKGEQFLKSHGFEYDFSWTAIRPTITFGDTRIPVGFSSKRNTYTLAERIVSHKPVLRFDDPKTRHAFCHVSIFGEAVVRLFLNEKAYSQCYHISDDVAYTYDEIFESIEKVLGVKGIYVNISSQSILKYSRATYEEMIYDKDPEFVLDNRKIKEICPGLNFRVNLDSVIEETIKNLEDKRMSIEQDEEYDVISDLILMKEVKKNVIADQRVIDYINTLPEDYIRILKKYDYKCARRNIVQSVKNMLRPIKQILIDN